MQFEIHPGGLRLLVPQEDVPGRREASGLGREPDGAHECRTRPRSQADIHLWMTAGLEPAVPDDRFYPTLTSAVQACRATTGQYWQATTDTTPPEDIP